MSRNFSVQDMFFFFEYFAIGCHDFMVVDYC